LYGLVLTDSNILVFNYHNIHDIPRSTPCFPKPTA
jgi:hypothetical protein